MNPSSESSMKVRETDPEVAPRAKRRTFSNAEKQRIVREANHCTKPGEIGALMRREGIYSSMLASWRTQQACAERAALAPPKRGSKPAANLAEQRELKQLSGENARLRSELKRAQIIIDVQKKLCTLLGLPTADWREEP
jgi:transposase-like protein